MPLIYFDHRFAAAVKNGDKRQTIRKERKQLIKPGDKLILGEWRVKPYRSKCRILRTVLCKSAFPITIGGGAFGDEIEIAGLRLSGSARTALARDDGFCCTTEMIEWFRKTCGLPFHGVVIEW